MARINARRVDARAARVLAAADSGEHIALQPLTPADADAALAPIHHRGDRWMGWLVGAHAFLALALAPAYDTWTVTASVVPLAVLTFYAVRWRHPGAFVTRATAGVVLQAFCALHIYQLNGLAEMHFFYFTSVSAMVLHQDWRAIWPGIAAIIAQHTLFSILHNAGLHPGGQQFFEPLHISAGKLAWHYGIAVVQSGIASYAAVVLRRRTLRAAAQRAALAAQAEELETSNAELQEQTLELEVQAHSLQEQAAELELTNDQLHDQQAELEAQAQALAEQTALAEGARTQLVATLERIGDGFFALDRAWRFTYVNARAEPLLGRKPVELVGRVVWEEFPEAVGSTFWREYHGAMQTGVPARFEEFFPPLDRWFAVTAYPDDDGLAVFFQDVTQRRRIEQQLRESEARFRLVQAASPDGFMLFRSVRDPDTRAIVDFTWLYVNSAGEQLVGRREADLTGERLLTVLPGNRTEGLFDAYVGVVETGVPLRRELHYAHDGVDRWFAITAVRVDDGFGVTFADVSARKEAERAIEAARRAAEDANRAKAEFLASMSHELRTPLNAIGGYAELLALGIRGPVTPQQVEDLARIQRSQRHLLGLITDILNYAKVEAGRLDLRAERVDVAELLASTDALVAPLVAAKGLDYQMHVGAAPGGAPLSAWGDADKVQQIVLNLVGNAVKFTAAPGTVRVAASWHPRREDVGHGRTPAEIDAAVAAGWSDVPGREAGSGRAGWLAITVRDTGRGIPADRLEAIFEPFVQAERHRTAEGQQGVGLGLSISRELARAMGGDVRVASTPGIGSTFTLLLPTHDERLAAHAAAAAPGAP